MLCIILACTSCKKDDLLIDIKGEPDKVIEDVSGTLYYNKYFKMWEVRHFIPGTIDSVDLYLIAKMPYKKFKFEEGGQVFVSGLCYEIPHQILFDKDKGIYSFYPAGVDFFYIKVTDLKYKD